MIFGKNLRTLGRGDIETLLGEPEREDLEFKGQLPGSKPGDPKSWYVGGSDISKDAKEGLAKELIAFANRNGGTLVLGIDETADKPACGGAIVPLPRPHEFADQIRRCFHDIIKPPLSFEVIGVATELDGAGVVVFQTGSSISAPHRLELKSAAKECYIRRDDESVPMDMRSIHDLVMERMRFSSRIDDVFGERAKQFRAFANLADARFAEERRLVTPDHGGAFRITAIAAEHISIADISTRNEFQLARVAVQSSRGSLNPFPLGLQDYRPILRGWKAANGDGFSYAERFVSGAGFLEDRTIVCSTRPHFLDREPQRHIHHWWIMHSLVNVICLVERFRNLADRSSLEFVLEFELRIPKGWRLLADSQIFGVHGFQHDSNDEFLPSHRLSVGNRREFPMLLKQLEIDLWSIFGAPPPSQTQIDFEAMLES